MSCSSSSVTLPSSTSRSVRFYTWAPRFPMPAPARSASFQPLDIPQEVRDAPDARPVTNGVRGERQSSGHAARWCSTPPSPRQHPLGARDLRISARPCVGRRWPSIPAGESVALIGPSGAGKTTLLQLLPRFYDPDLGSVQLEGADLRQLRLKDLRAQVALVRKSRFFCWPALLRTSLTGNQARRWRRSTNNLPALPVRTALSPTCPDNMTRSWARGRPD